MQSSKHLSVNEIKELIETGKLKLNGNHSINNQHSYELQSGKIKMLCYEPYQRWLTIGELI